MLLQEEELAIKAAKGPLLVTPDGRTIQDPDNPEDLLRAIGDTGVKIRMRTVIGRRRRAVTSEWEYTDPFTLDNNAAPAVTLDGVEQGSVVVVHWTAFDDDSEDANGNGVLDFLEGEDRNGNGEFDIEQIAVAFDFHRLEPGEDPRSMSLEDLEALHWLPCTRAADVGQPDDGVASSPLGVPHVFGWDWAADPMAPDTAVILRARGYDGKEHSSYTYITEAFTPVP